MTQFINILSKVSSYIRRPVVISPVFFVVMIVLLRPVFLTEQIATLESSSLSKSGLLFIYDLFGAVLTSYVLSTTLFVSFRILKCFWYTLGILLFLVSLFLSLTFGRIISPITIQQFLETDALEASEFISSVVFSPKGLVSIAVTICIIVIIVVLERKQKQIKIFLQKTPSRIKHAFSIVLLIVLPLGAKSFGINPYSESWESTSMNTANLICHSLPILYDNKDAEKISELSNKLSNSKLPIAQTINDNLVITMVLGESLNKKHCSPYGYYLQTMPNIDKEVASGSAFVFSDVVTPFNYTISCVKNIFFTNSMAKGEQYFNTPFFPQLFHQSGFKVLICDCQTNFYADDSEIAHKENGILHNPTLSRFSYDIDYKIISQYDRENVDSFISSYPPQNAPRLQIFHLKGQHDGASQRYPHIANYMKFSKDDIKSDKDWADDAVRNHIAAYDNAVLYNDFVLGDIINSVKSLNSVVIFFPDHGEEVYDYRDSYLRLSPTPGMEMEWAEHQFSIPFIIYVSDIFKTRYPDMVEKIQQSVYKPFSTDVVSHIFLDIAKIKAFYNPALDPLSSQFIPLKRIITESDGRYKYDYDEITK